MSSADMRSRYHAVLQGKGGRLRQALHMRRRVRTSVDRGFVIPLRLPLRAADSATCTTAACTTTAAVAGFADISHLGAAVTVLQDLHPTSLPRIRY